MTGDDDTERSEAAPVDPEAAVKLRGDPPRVMRLSRKAIGIASACGFALVGGALIYALQPSGRSDGEELYNTDGAAVADNLELLVAPMLARFIATDRSFTKARRAAQPG